VAAQHLNPLFLLGGDLAGTLPNPTFRNSANATVAAAVFGRRVPATDLLERLAPRTAGQLLTADPTTLAGRKWQDPADTSGVGFRNVPRVASSGGTAAATIVGKCYSTSGNITIPDATFAAGDAFSIYNNTASPISIIEGSGFTLRQVGTTTTGDRTLSEYGFVSLWFESASVAVVMGAILT